MATKYPTSLTNAFKPTPMSSGNVGGMQTTTPAYIAPPPVAPAPAVQPTYRQGTNPAILGIINNTQAPQTKIPTQSTYKQGTNPAVLGAINSYSAPQTKAPSVSFSPKTVNAERTAYENTFRFAPQVTSGFSTPATTSGNPLSGAFNALKGFVSNVGSRFSKVGQDYGGQNSVAGTEASNLAPATFQPPSTSTSTGATNFSTDNTNTITNTQAVDSKNKIKPKVEEQYEVQTVNQPQDSGTVNLDSTQGQENTALDAQIEQIKSELLALRDIVQTNEQSIETQPIIDGIKEQSNTSGLLSQERGLLEELARLQQVKAEGSPEYAAAQQRLQAKQDEEAKIQADLTQGVTNVESQPVGMQFITGQSAALQRQANASLQSNAVEQLPLQRQLATEAQNRATKQAQNQAAIDVVEKRLGYTTRERERQQDRGYAISDKALERAYNKANAQFELSPGQTRYGSTGNVIASAPATPKTTSPIKSNKPTRFDIEQGRIRLDNSKNQGAEADGIYSDPSIYLQMYRDWVANGQTQADFLKQFPPSQYVNPSNTWLPSYLMPKNSNKISA